MRFLPDQAEIQITWGECRDGVTCYLFQQLSVAFKLEQETDNFLIGRQRDLA